MADQDTPSFYSTSVKGTDSSYQFKSAAELKAWAEEEGKAWAPILALESASISRPLRAPFDHVRGQLRNLFSLAVRYADNASPEIKTGLDQAFKNTFGNSRIPPNSRSFAAFLDRITAENRIQIR